MLKHVRSLIVLCLPSLLLLLSSNNAAAQVPDTTYRKPELPTGPPVPVEKQRPRVQEQPKPKPQVIEQELPVQQETDEEQLRFIDKLYFGGSLGLQFGTFTNISIMPTLSYAVFPKVFAGVGAVYHYKSGGGVNFNNYGGRGYLQGELVEIGGGALLAHGEVESLSVEYAYYDQMGRMMGKTRSSLTMPLVGLGYRQRISSKGSFDLLVLYNANDSFYNPYSNPVIRFGLNIPFTNR
ncbi:hypothetical protein [Pontibacter akesuensis]|uniref:Outer membrane protein beta-barrel domain-containing protein n=1 Tax=Pontibacter akesuensis TaxID=388950 RepID=A0A1I7FWP3_9BACT|nr:hypothetical protein [Pontibacter akesuensis]GHA60198.1 hypothetical protein GCM10007389_10530 [Pontibacter akesuensis]SFU40456.1 hypothetical protein SAMN04487941_0509 [Pontibacter akesuensis]